MLSASALQLISSSALMTSRHPKLGLLLIFMFSMSVIHSLAELSGFSVLIPSRSLEVRPNTIPSSYHLADAGASALTNSAMDGVSEKE